jgi:hypothetical protein
LPSLCELRFELTNNILRADDIDDVVALEDVIAPFINGVSATLEALYYEEDDSVSSTFASRPALHLTILCLNLAHVESSPY